MSIDNIWWSYNISFWKILCHYLKTGRDRVQQHIVYRISVFNYYQCKKLVPGCSIKSHLLVSGFYNKQENIETTLIKTNVAEQFVLNGQEWDVPGRHILNPWIPCNPNVWEDETPRDQNFGPPPTDPAKRMKPICQHSLWSQIQALKFYSFPFDLLYHWMFQKM